MDYSYAVRELFFHYKAQHVMSVGAAALKVSVKESTARNWWREYNENIGTEFVVI